MLSFPVVLHWYHYHKISLTSQEKARISGVLSAILWYDKIIKTIFSDWFLYCTMIPSIGRRHLSWRKSAFSALVCILILVSAISSYQKKKLDESRAADLSTLAAWIQSAWNTATLPLPSFPAIRFPGSGMEPTALRSRPIPIPFPVLRSKLRPGHYFPRTGLCKGSLCGQVSRQFRKFILNRCYILYPNRYNIIIYSKALYLFGCIIVIIRGHYTRSGVIPSPAPWHCTWSGI